jgi:hypothetical protein
MYAQEILALRYMELCQGVVISETSSNFAQIIFSQDYTNNIYLYSIHTWHRYEQRKTYVY